MWKLTVGIDHYWLSDEEKETVLKALGNGKDFIALKIGAIIATRSIQSLVPQELLDNTKRIDDGEWMCEKGKWHKLNTECRCGKEYVIEDGLAKLKDKEE